MPLIVTLDLTPDLEAELRSSVTQGDTARVRQLLTDALTPTVEALLQAPLSPAENEPDWEYLVEQLLATVANAAPQGLPPLSEYATSRAGIYEERP